MASNVKVWQGNVIAVLYPSFTADSGLQNTSPLVTTVSSVSVVVAALIILVAVCVILAVVYLVVKTRRKARSRSGIINPLYENSGLVMMNRAYRNE